MKKKQLHFFCCCVLIAQTTAAQPATIHVNLNKETGAMKPVWAWFGYKEPNREDFQRKNYCRQRHNACRLGEAAQLQSLGKPVKLDILDGKLLLNIVLPQQVLRC